MFLRRRSPHGERGLKCLRAVRLRRASRSLPARGAWIEILFNMVDEFAKMSLPARGAWIEIITAKLLNITPPSLPARGAWIEIYPPCFLAASMQCRSPHGERGLKYADLLAVAVSKASLPARGAWIEI